MQTLETRLSEILLHREQVLWQGASRPPAFLPETRLAFALALPLFFSVCILPLLPAVGLCLLGLFLLLWAWRRKRRLALMRYVLTDRRLLIFSPAGWVALPLEPGLVHSRVFRPGGAGDLLLRTEHAGGNIPCPQGIFYLPDLHRVDILISEAERNFTQKELSRYDFGRFD